jgi:hypothetical protein
MTKTFTMHLYWNKYGTGDNTDPARFSLWSSDDIGDYYASAHVYVGPVEVQVDVPDDIDPKALELAHIRAQEQKVRAAFAQRMTELQRQANELLALDMDPV